MSKKNIPAIIMLLAGTIACVSCLINETEIINTLKIVLITLIVFYIIGRIVSFYIEKINKQADVAATEAALAAQEADKQQRRKDLGLNEDSISDEPSEIYDNGSLM